MGSGGISIVHKCVPYSPRM